MYLFSMHGIFQYSFIKNGAFSIKCGTFLYLSPMEKCSIENVAEKRFPLQNIDTQYWIFTVAG